MQSQYHSYCPIEWGNAASEQNCWLGDTKVTCPGMDLGIAGDTCSVERLNNARAPANSVQPYPSLLGSPLDKLFWIYKPHS